jgi:hypothetical protein
MHTNISWVEKELENTYIRDERLLNRLISVTKSLAANPVAPLTQALGGWNEVRGCYRMVNNKNITTDVILSGHSNETIERIKNHSVILVPQDTTSFDFSYLKDAEGLGPYSTSNDKMGMLLHTSMAMTTEGVPLGLLKQQYWVRDEIDPSRDHKQLPIEEKESYKWIENQQGSLDKIPSDVRVVSVSDRESDIYEYLRYNVENNHSFIVRAMKDRRVLDYKGNTLQKVLVNQPAGGQITVEVPRNTRENKPSRKARLEIKYCPITIRPPKNKPFTKGAPDLQIYVVLAQEISTPPEGVKPIRWVLLTDIKVETLEDAVKIIKWYAQRWKIERFHYILKGGCKIDDLQLCTGERLENMIAIYSIIAWKILYMTYEARENPDEDCGYVFKEHEWQALYCFINETPIPPKKAPSLHETIMMVAKLGGFLGRKGDGYPGAKVLWRGLARLHDIAKFWLITHSHFSSNDVDKA